MRVDAVNMAYAGRISYAIIKLETQKSLARARFLLVLPRQP